MAHYHEDEEIIRTEVICPKHGKVAESITGTHLVSIGVAKYCPTCFADMLKSHNLFPLKEDMRK
jgi:hypothetical protein